MFAHSDEELDEWKRRWKYRADKRALAPDLHLYSYMDNILKDYEQSDAGIDVVRSYTLSTGDCTDTYILVKAICSRP